jgi:hypothetical protein
MKPFLAAFCLLLIWPLGMVQSAVPTALSLSSAQGLERFLDPGPIDSMLGAFTKKITDAKSAIDAYRIERTTRVTDTLIPEDSRDSADYLRAQMEKTEGSLWQKFVVGIGALLSHLWTLVLWLLSSILAYPLLVQTGLLIMLIYMLVRILRGSRRRTVF